VRTTSAAVDKPEHRWLVRDIEGKLYGMMVPWIGYRISPASNFLFSCPQVEQYNAACDILKRLSTDAEHKNGGAKNSLLIC
jgi:hypothetical protein